MKINFIKLGNLFTILSILIVLFSIVILYKKKLSLGLEFNGGTEIEIEIYEEKIFNLIKKDLEYIKSTKINYFGSNKIVKIRTTNLKKNLNEIKNIIKKFDNKQVKIIRYSYIGAEINNDTTTKCIIAIISAILSMYIYLAIRFNNKFSLCTMLTLMHDILILLGIIAFLNIEINLITLSALFTIFGYSVNDTIIIFDRIREYLKNNKKENMKNIINLSINNTISRTISTSFSTLIVTIILLLFCSNTLFEFSLILTIGIIIGTYSSIYISAIPLIFFEKK